MNKIRVFIESKIKMTSGEMKRARRVLPYFCAAEVFFFSVASSFITSVFFGLRLWQSFFLMSLGLANLLFVVFCYKVCRKGMARADQKIAEAIAEERKFETVAAHQLSTKIPDVDLVEYEEMCRNIVIHNNSEAEESWNDTIEETWSEIIEVPENYQWRKQ